MNRKVKIILLSTITPITTLPLIAISCNSEDPEKEIDKIRVYVVLLDKFAKDVIDTDIRITGYRSSIFSVSHTHEVDKTDPTILKVNVVLTNKNDNTSAEKTFEVRGFRKMVVTYTPEEKVINQAINAITLSYEGGKEVLKKLDAGDLEIDKVKLEGASDEFEFKKSFKNKIPTKQNYNEGFRTIVVIAKKNENSLIKEFKLCCYKTDYDVIVNQREKVKNITLSQTQESKNAVEALFSNGKTEVEIFYDIDQKTYFDKKETESNRKNVLNLQTASWEKDTVFGDGKLVKLSENKYKAFVTLGKSYKVNELWEYIYDSKQIETNVLSFGNPKREEIDRVRQDNQDIIQTPKELVVQEEKKKNIEFNVDVENSFAIKLKDIEKSSTLPSDVKNENILFELKDEYSSIIGIQNYELIYNDNEGKLKIKVTLMINTPSTTKVVEKEEIGFKTNIVTTKKFMLQELYNESISKTLIGINLDLKNEIIQHFTKIKDQGEGKRLLTIKKGIFYTASNGSKITGLSIKNSSISSEVNTHGGQGKDNIVKPDKKIGGSTKGILLVKEDKKWIAKWKLILQDGKEDDEVFQQELFTED
ncbi:variable surface lipoprotein [Metamycoplasma hyosynoviae]|uniref:variable surface lipoprotein n=1 Tax=Metamycoplasma hyosynoviae TaxID=29559 RepID=UPI0023589D47|nr:variable surface lipoprotein [Metamycoplasma hyosynoviae]MDC8921261.1 variable surface lipoprotein [Metamycoplasma hyosynoviae]